MRPSTGAVLLLFIAAFAVGWWVLQATDDATRAPRLGAFGLLLGGGLLALCWDALDTGRVRLRTIRLERATRPALFWLAVGLNAACGLALILAGFVYLRPGA